MTDNRVYEYHTVWPNFIDFCENETFMSPSFLSIVRIDNSKSRGSDVIILISDKESCFLGAPEKR